jgi:hypothetical protein
MIVDSSTSPPFHQLAFTHDDYFPSDQDSLAPSSSLAQVGPESDMVLCPRIQFHANGPLPKSIPMTSERLRRPQLRTSSNYRERVWAC